MYPVHTYMNRYFKVVLTVAISLSPRPILDFSDPWILVKTSVVYIYVAAKLPKLADRK